MPSPLPPPPDLAGFRAQLGQLLAAGDHAALVGAVLTLVAQMAQANHQLAGRLQAALRLLYRKKSERVSPAQLALFLAQLPRAEAAQAEVAAAPPDDPAAAAPPDDPAAAAPRRPRGKQPFPAHLRREVTLVPVPAAQRQCGVCGSEKTPMGYETQIVWEFKPAEFFLVEERRETRACRACQGEVVTAPGSPKPQEGGRPGPGLLAQIVTAKFRDAIPLYRQSQIYARSGITLAPSTLGDWVTLAAEIMEPLYHQARDDTLGCYLVSTDDTGLPVLDRDHPRGVKRGHLWTYVGDQGAVAFCDYTPDWKGEHPQAVLAAFRGQVAQGDGYSGLDAYFARPGAPVRAGCRVGGDVAVPTPHRPGRADFPHPVPHATASLAATATADAVPDSLVEDRAQPTRLGASAPGRLSAPVSLTRLRASECPPCCPDAGLFAWRPPSLARVPVSRVPRGRRYYAGATTSHESPGALMVSGARTTRRLPLRSPAAETLRGSRVRSGAVDHAARWCGRRGISQVPERSILYLCRVLRPRPGPMPLASRDIECCPRLHTRRRPQRSA